MHGRKPAADTAARLRAACIPEALGLKLLDVRLVDGMTESVRVIGKDDQERLAPLPEAFGHVFGFWKRVITGQVVRRRALCAPLGWLWTVFRKPSS